MSLEHLTGESLPLSKVPGDEVPAGALDNDGLLVIRTTRTSADSTPARIAKLTAAAQSRRPNVQRLIDKIGDRYSAAVLGASLLFMAVGPMLGLQLLGPGGAAYRAMGFLSAAAPCAVVMAPLAYVAAIGTCAQRGALVRGGLTIDALADVGCIALDKTGTLTTGVLRLNSIERLCDGQLATSALGAKGSPPSEPRAFAVALALAQRSLHPVSRAIVASAGELDPGALPVVSVDGFRVVHGSGVEGTVTLAGDSRPMFARFGACHGCLLPFPSHHRSPRTRRRLHRFSLWLTLSPGAPLIPVDRLGELRGGALPARGRGGAPRQGGGRKPHGRALGDVPAGGGRRGAERERDGGVRRRPDALHFLGHGERAQRGRHPGAARGCVAGAWARPAQDPHAHGRQRRQRPQHCLAAWHPPGECLLRCVQLFPQPCFSKLVGAAKGEGGRSVPWRALTSLCLLSPPAVPQDCRLRTR